MSGRVHDVLGIGAGPFNLGLACLAEPTGLDVVLLERRDGLRWHPGMLLEESVLQVPFLADLVTMADPTSPYSFLAYLKETGRLYPFYVRESFYPLRREFDAYCRWAGERLGVVRLHQEAVDVRLVEVDGETVHEVTCTDPRDGSATTWRGRHLVLGVGSRPHVPSALAGLRGRAWHTSEYLQVRETLRETRDVTVLGSGQSAAEVVTDLLDAPGSDRQQLRWLTRSPRFFPLEYTKLTLELTSPEYSAHFRGLPADDRQRLLRSQAGLYKGISAPVVDGVHERLYRRALDDVPQPELAACCEVVAGRTEDDGRHVLQLRQTETDEHFEVTTDAVVMATGYAQPVPRLLDGLGDHLRRDPAGRLLAGDDFSVDTGGGDSGSGSGRVFVQNAEAHTHGFVAPDLGMGAWRNAAILERVLGHAPYVVERSTMFQAFGVPDHWEAVQRVPVPTPANDGRAAS